MSPNFLWVTLTWKWTFLEGETCKNPQKYNLTLWCTPSEPTYLAHPGSIGPHGLTWSSKPVLPLWSIFFCWMGVQKHVGGWENFFSTPPAKHQEVSKFEKSWGPFCLLQNLFWTAFFGWNAHFYSTHPHNPLWGVWCLATGGIYPLGFRNIRSPVHVSWYICRPDVCENHIIEYSTFMISSRL